MKVSACPACGAPVHPLVEQCPYCQQYLISEHGKRVSNSETNFSGVLFHRRSEPIEDAFSLLVPKGWMLEGGIQRPNLMTQVVDAQSIEAKLDLTIKSDPAGMVMLRLCPEIKFCDMRYSPARMMFPPGSNYAGMIVSPLMSAVDFLVQSVFPWAHPNLQHPAITNRQAEPLLAENYRRKMAALKVPTPFQYDGGAVTFQYWENNTQFIEKMFTVIENMGPIAGGMWSNKDTVLLRAPVEQFEVWEPIFLHMIDSIRLNFEWLAGEIVNQEFLSRSFQNAQQAQNAREQRMHQIQQQMQQMDREIQDSHMRTQAEIMNDNYLNLMSLEEYVNPITNEIDTGSNQWDYRWVNPNGDELYTDDESDDPNIPGLLNRSDWQKSKIRPRFPQ